MKLMYLYIQTIHIFLFMQVLALILSIPPYHHHIKSDMELQKGWYIQYKKALWLDKLGKTFSQKNINAQVTVFNESILSIFRYYIPNKYITCDDKDPVWMNENIKSRIKF